MSLLIVIFRLFGGLFFQLTNKKFTRTTSLNLSIYGVLLTNLSLFILGHYKLYFSNIFSPLIVKILELISTLVMNFWFISGIHILLFAIPEIIVPKYRVWFLRLLSSGACGLTAVSIVIFPFMIRAIQSFTFLVYVEVCVLYLVWTRYKFIDGKEPNPIKFWIQLRDQKSLW